MKRQIIRKCHALSHLVILLQSHASRHFLPSAFTRLGAWGRSRHMGRRPQAPHRILWFECDSWLANVQGKPRQFGSFRDAVSAARRYDELATQFRGKRAVLNFPPDGNPNPTFTGAHGRTGRPLLLNGGRGSAVPVSNGIVKGTRCQPPMWRCQLALVNRPRRLSSRPWNLVKVPAR